MSNRFAATRRCLAFTVVSAGILVAQLMLSDPANAQAKRSGYLCCNLHVYKDWISDINYRFEGTKLLRVGLPIKAHGDGSYYFTARVGGKQRYLGNDYSRSLSERVFLSRYITPEDPTQKLAQYDEFTQDAIKTLRIMPGMTQEQVAMSLGYPVANYTPQLAARKWQYWLDRSSSFDVHFGADRKVKHVSGDWSVVSRILYTPSPTVVEQAQAMMNSMGIHAGDVDGLMGQKTRSAIREYQQRANLDKNGVLDVATLTHLGISSQKQSFGSPVADTPASKGFGTQVIRPSAPLVGKRGGFTNKDK